MITPSVIAAISWPPPLISQTFHPNTSLHEEGGKTSAEGISYVTSLPVQSSATVYSTSLPVEGLATISQPVESSSYPVESSATLKITL